MNKDIVRLITRIVLNDKIRYINTEYRGNYKETGTYRFVALNHINNDFAFNWRNLKINNNSSIHNLFVYIKNNCKYRTVARLPYNY